MRRSLGSAVCLLAAFLFVAPIATIAYAQDSGAAVEPDVPAEQPEAAAEPATSEPAPADTEDSNTTPDAGQPPVEDATEPATDTEPSEPAEESTAEPPPDAAETAADEESAAEAEAMGSDWFSGSFNAGFDGQWSDDDSDINLNQTLRLDITPPKYPRIRLRSSLWLHEDLDSDESRHSALRDINDSYGSDLRARLLHLYLEVDDLWGDSTLRLGRQRIIDGVVFNRIDGLYFKQRHPRWDWYVFGGARASLYESRDDVSLGAGASWRATSRTRLALDFYYGDEERRDGEKVWNRPIRELFGLWYPRRVRGDVTDRVAAFSIWQDITPNLRFFGRYILNDGDSDELVLDLTGFVPKWDFSYEFAYRRRMDDAGDRVNDATSFYRVLGVQDEYDNFLLSLHKPLNETFTLSFEAEVHRADEDLQYTANRDYERYAVILSAQDLFAGVDTTLAVERWDVDHGESTWSITGELARKWDRFEAALGADYERYKDEIYAYNPWPFTVRQIINLTVPGVFPGFMPIVWLLDEDRDIVREDIYSIYGRLKWSIDDAQDLTARLTFEEDDGVDSPYWRFQLNYEIRF